MDDIIAGKLLLIERNHRLAFRRQHDIIEEMLICCSKAPAFRAGGCVPYTEPAAALGEDGFAVRRKEQVLQSLAMIETHCAEARNSPFGQRIAVGIDFFLSRNRKGAVLLPTAP